jgi:tRNA A-37 threonylcarbamoyl transferase component Bud32
MSPSDTTVEFVRRCRHCGLPLSASSSFCSKCGATADTPAGGVDQLRETLKRLFGADLEIEREIGRGGMAAVYSAFDPALQRRVAVKVLLPEIANDPSMADRFLREARTVAALQHPHVVTVYAVRSGEGAHAIVMQFVEGRSLDAVLLERGQIPVSVAGMLLSQAAAGLQHAHDRGVVHRDVKPANVLIEHDGRAIVSDFGIARRDSGPRTTDTGLVVGTWAYMSPEQRAGDQITPATDQYALGVMAFELLTGRLPFTGTVSEVLRAHMHDPPPSLRAIRPEVSLAVEALVHRMLAKAPEARFPSLKEAERVFRTLVPHEGKTTLQLAAFAKVPAPSGSSVVVAATRGAPALRAPFAPRHRASFAIVGAAVLVVALLGVWASQRRGASVESGARATSAQPVASQPSSLAPQAAIAQTQGASAQTQRVPARAGSSGDPGAAGVTFAPAPLVSQRTQPITSVPATDPVSPAQQSAAEKSPIAPPKPEAAVPVAAVPAASTADARKLGREFVTMLNQRRYRDLAQVPQVGGDAALRAELIKLTESAPDFAAGFDRLPSAPGEWKNGFETEFFLDLQWRGGKKLLHVRLFAAGGDAGWRLAGMSVDIAN